MKHWRIRKSALFRRQLSMHAQDYKERAGKDIAHRFADEAEQAIAFIRQRPEACARSLPGPGYEDVRAFGYRKWRLKHFPHTILFREESDDCLCLEAIYAQKMDIAARFADDLMDD